MTPAEAIAASRARDPQRGRCPECDLPAQVVAHLIEICAVKIGQRQAARGVNRLERAGLLALMPLAPAHDPAAAWLRWLLGATEIEHRAAVRCAGVIARKGIE